MVKANYIWVCDDKNDSSMMLHCCSGKAQLNTNDVMNIQKNSSPILTARKADLGHWPGEIL